jgi:hypothetical protein
MLFSAALCSVLPAALAGGAGDLKLTLLPEAANATGAVCLDGSPAGYYWRKGVGDLAAKFLVAIQGGGWCYGPDEATVKKDCASRATGKLGTSTLWTPWIPADVHGMTSANCTVNPAFCNWSVAYIYYCDGHSFSGDVARPVEVDGGDVSPIYLRGRRVLDANIAHLLESRGMDGASQVVLAGHSAGGLATYLHADRVRALLPVRLRSSFSAVPDAGFFLDHADVSGALFYGTHMRAAFKLANATPTFNAKCLAAQGAASDCVFPQHFAQYIETPMHVIQSQYDEWQLQYILRLPCMPPKGGGCNASMLSAFQAYRVATMAALNASGLFAGREGYGIWNDACIAHTQGFYGDYYDNTAWRVPASAGPTLAQSVAAWLAGRPSTHVDEVAWPNNSPCHSFGVQGLDV